jgi:L-rhamnose mutarotase
MLRKAFKMSLYPYKLSEYKKRHNPIWKELESILKNHGVHNYSIFFDNETHALFGYAEIESEEEWKAISKMEICNKWRKHMADLMKTNQDNSPTSIELKEVFYLD